MRMGAKTMLMMSLLALAFVSWLASAMDPYFQSVVIDTGINIILAVSLNLVIGFTGQFSLGHAGLMAVGGYMAAALTTVAGLSRFHAVAVSMGSWGIAVYFLAVLFLGGLMAAFFGLLIGVPSLRLRGDYLAIVTLGFGEIIRVLLQNMEVVGGARGLSGIPPYTNLLWTYGSVLVTIYVVVCLVNSTYGRGFLAVRDDEVAAGAMGINPTKYKVTAFVIGAFFAGIAGGLYAHYKQFLNPDGFGFMRSIEIVVMVILGGKGSTPGVILAAIIMTFLPEVLRPVAEYRMILYSLLLVILMLVCPEGLFRGSLWLSWINKLGRWMPRKTPKSLS